MAALAKSTASGSVGTGAAMRATVTMLSGHAMISCAVSNGTLPALASVPSVINTPSAEPGPLSVRSNAIIARAGTAARIGTRSSLRYASLVVSGIWLKRKSRFSPRNANSSMSVMPGSLAL